MSFILQLLSSVMDARQFRFTTAAGICGKLLIAFIGAVPVGLVVAAPSDCAGTSLDGQAACILPTYAPTVYSYCVQTGYAAPENAMSNCSNTLGYSIPYTSSEQLESILNCAIAPNTYPGPVPWAAPGQTIVDSNLCWTITASVVNGVDVRGWARTNPNWGWNVIFRKDTASSCPAGHTGIYKNLNGVNELVSCKPIVSGTTCAADSEWNSSLNSCILKIDILRSAAKPPGSTCKNPGVGDPIYPLTGANTQPVDTGFSIGTETLKLTYDTARQLSGLTSGNLPSFGPLWVSNLHRNLSISTGGTAIKAYRGNGGMLTFVLKGGVYTPDGDINDRIVTVAGGYAYTDAAEQKVELYNSAGQLTSVTDSSGKTLSFSYSVSETATAPAAGYLMQVIANTGRILRFEYGLAPGANAVLNGRISKITDATGAFISTTYDAGGNLSAITWPDGKVRQFLYENISLPWALTGVTDENNDRFLTFAYDSQGLAVSSERAGGVDRYSVSYASSPTRTITEFVDSAAKIKYRYHEIQPPLAVSLTQPMGQSVSWSASGAVGSPVITGSSQPAGSGCAAANNASSYEANGNLLSHDNFQEERSCYAYDSSNRETTRIDGLATTIDCASVLPVGAVIPPGSRKTLTQWHPDWRLKKQISTADSVSTTIFNGQTDPSTGLTLNCSSVTNLPTGKPVPLECKRIIRSSIDASTRTSQFTYSDAGYLLTARDSLGHESTYQYANTNNSALDDAFDRVRVLLHGDGVNGAAVFLDNSSPEKAVSVAYGTPTTSETKSKFGSSSMYFPGGASVAVAGVSGATFWTSDWTVEFWAATDVSAQSPGAIFGNRDNSGLGMGGGQLYLSYSAGVLTGITFELGERSTWAGFGVDVSTPGFIAARVASGFDHVAVTKQGLAYTFFLNGVKLSSITRPISAMNSPSDVLYVGAANKHQFYPYYFRGHVDDFRITMGASRYLNGFVPRTTAFPNAGYPPDADLALYNLQSITNAAGHITRYTQYDRAGRIRQMIDPKGVVTDSTYTLRGWLASTTVTPPEGVARTTTYTYDAAGQLTGVQMPDGSTLAYVYDAAHRLTGVMDAKGNTITYALDNMGNRVGEQVKDPQGNLQRNITRVYDALNRVEKITGAGN